MSNDSAVDPVRARIEALWASIGVIVFLGAIKHLSAVSPLVYGHGFTLALAFQLYVPLYLIGRNGVSRDSLGLSWIRLPRSGEAFRAWRTAVGPSLFWLAVVSVLTIVPYAIGLHYYLTIGFGRPFNPTWPTGILENLAINFFLVGLGEELFFRGYLQERVDVRLEGPLAPLRCARRPGDRRGIGGLCACSLHWGVPSGPARSVLSWSGVRVAASQNRQPVSAYRISRILQRVGGRADRFLSLRR